MGRCGVGNQGDLSSWVLVPAPRGDCNRNRMPPGSRILAEGTGETGRCVRDEERRGERLDVAFQVREGDKNWLGQEANLGEKGIEGWGGKE